MWYGQNQNVSTIPTLLFPFTILLEDSLVQIINNTEEFDSILWECVKHEYLDDLSEEGCYETTFPISFNLPNGTMHTVNNPSEILEILLAFYLMNPEEKEEPELVFPVNVKLADGTIQQIDTEQNLEDLEELCDD